MNSQFFKIEKEIKLIRFFQEYLVFSRQKIKKERKKGEKKKKEIRKAARCQSILKQAHIFVERLAVMLREPQKASSVG